MPIIVITVAAMILAIPFSINPLILGFLALELVLQIERFKAWDEIPLAAAASIALQKHLTTKSPNTEELQTAQLALENLVKKHESL